MVNLDWRAAEAREVPELLIKNPRGPQRHEASQDFWNKILEARKGTRSPGTSGKKITEGRRGTRSPGTRLDFRRSVFDVLPYRPSEPVTASIGKKKKKGRVFRKSPSTLEAPVENHKCQSNVNAGKALKPCTYKSLGSLRAHARLASRGRSMG